jgi:tetratricopeptide (TPR) repeat protein/tRNA A-37 threonylcarbamoyl transferase component Bud32
MACPDDTQLSAFIARTLATPTAARLEAHIADCDECRKLLFALASGSVDPAETAPVERIGRFEVLELVGQGAMGMVYRARDPDLDRVVAIKVRRSASRLDPDGEERLRREAQALARLTHPNVVAVYETGRFERATYIAMEYVEGASLEDWLTAAKRPQSEIIERMIEAGRGLAAAHAVGLVHRDFKPRNVFVARTGTAKVGDFGLVRLGEEGAAPRIPAVDGPLTLTMTGSMLGTPAYMSPEQLRGEPATERSDQFSFCVALHETLYGRRPFVGTTIEGLLAAMTKPVTVPVAPRRIARVLVRGLAIDPAQRFASMSALLDVLDDRVTRRRRRTVAIGVAVVAAVASGGVIAATREPAANAELCSGGDRRVAEMWNAARKVELRAKFLATNVPFATDAWRTVERSLDRFTGEWAAMHRNACEATRVRGEQSTEMLDLRMWCLDDRMREASALADAFAAADGRVVARAVDAASKLPALDVCTDARTLAERQLPRDAAQRQRIEHLQAEVARGETAARLGKLDEAIASLERVVAAAKTERYAPLEAEASLWLARNKFRLDVDAKAAEQAVLQALWAADRGHDDVLRARAWIVLTFLVGIAQSRFEEGHRHVEHARATIRRLRNSGSLEGQLLGNEGQLLAAEGKMAEAEVVFERATAMVEESLGSDSVDVGQLLAVRSELASRRGDRERALELAERAYQIHLRTYGPHHPEAAKTAFSIAKALEDGGEYDRAAEKLAAGIEVFEAALGRDHHDVAVSLGELGIVRRHQNRLAEALELHQRELKIYEKTLPPDSNEIGISLGNIGLVLTMLGRAKEALPLHVRALQITTNIFGPDHMETAAVRGHLANAYLGLERHAEALPVFREALAITEKALGPDDFELSFFLSGIGSSLRGLNRPAEAIPHFERALRIRGDRGDQLVTLETKFLLAAVLWESKRDRNRARALLAEVRPGYKAAKLTRVEEWLAEHPGAAFGAK